MSSLIDFILHIDIHLAALVQEYGLFVYLIVFAIIFIETGFVIMPFLPGDSLLFAAGALAAVGNMNLVILFVVLILAAILGDSLNYFLGYKVGHNVFKRESGILQAKYRTYHCRA